MTSFLFEQARKGDEVSLLEITWQLEHHQLLTEDVQALYDLASRYDGGEKMHPTEQYLLSLACCFGAGFFVKQEETAKKILNDLIQTENFALAKSMLAYLSEDHRMQSYRNLMEKENEPLATLNVVNLTMREFGCRLAVLEGRLKSPEGDQPISLMSLGFGYGSPNPLKTTSIAVVNEFGQVIGHNKRQSFFSPDDLPKNEQVLVMTSLQLSLLADVYQQVLRKTSYKSDTDRLIEAFHQDLIYLKQYFLQDKTVDAPSDKKSFQTFKEIFGDKHLKGLSEFMLVLAEYYKKTSQMTLMYEMLQHAVEINPELDTKLFVELVGDEAHYSWVKGYLYNYLGSAESFAVQVKDISTNEEVIKTNFRQLSVDFKNCVYLVKKLNNTLCTEKELKEIHELGRACEQQHNGLKDKVEAREGLQEIKSRLSMK